MFKHFILNRSRSPLKRANVMFETFFTNPPTKLPSSIRKGFQRVGLLVNFDDYYTMVMVMCGT